MKFDNKQFSLKEREKRREELWDTFEDIIRTAKSEKIRYLFISGDLTQGEYLTFKALKRIAKNFNSINETRVILTCGKEDPYNINSLYQYIDWPKNVYLVDSTDSVQKLIFQDDNLCIYSMSWSNSDINENSQHIYDISVDENRTNVLLLYCDTNMGEKVLPVNADMVKNKFEYCAFGGSHNFIKARGNVIYCGSPEPLSFDEPGEHGIIKGTLEKNNTTFGFYPIATRKFITRKIDIEISYGFNKILDHIKFSGDTFSNIKDYIRVILSGTVNSDISIEEVKNEAKQFFYYIEFEENFIYKNSDEKKYEENEFNILESFKLQFENHNDKIEQQAFELGLEVLRKEKVVR
jgi:DNA repair exonuclease SbcCD nuclease subunit